jgi:riboflavin biosynthesis pyrimidine reductase
MAYVDFPAEKIRLRQIYRSDMLRDYGHLPLESGRIADIYGEILFPPFPGDRTYTFGSFVCSVDGRIAFPESADGTLVARSNRYDSYGGLCDFWILTMLRSLSGAVLMGSLTIQREPELTARIADRELERARVDAGWGPVPLHVVVTRSGANLPLGHQIFTSPDIPALIVTSAAGREKLLRRLAEESRLTEKSFRDVGEIGDDESVPAGTDVHSQTLSLIGVGEGEDVDTDLLLRVLKQLGIDTMLVESPTFLVSLMQRRKLDELYLNTSGLFVGGNALTIGENAPSFSVEDHPHTRTLSIHSHGDHFFYTRYSFMYE